MYSYLSVLLQKGKIMNNPESTVKNDEKNREREIEKKLRKELDARIRELFQEREDEISRTINNLCRDIVLGDMTKEKKEEAEQIAKGLRNAVRILDEFTNKLLITLCRP